MRKDLVSIITPCYNMEKHLYRLLDSVLAQTYRPIEFILVDDGSTDRSLELAESYRANFENAGIDYVIVHQENCGLAGAINAGLGRVTGEFICWPDADDYLEPSAVEEKVDALKAHPNCAVVTSNAYVRHEDNIEEKSFLVDGTSEENNNPKQFFNLLNEKSIYCSGCHMVRADLFFEVNPDKCIYPARRGQNWQMLLPLYYKYDRFFLDKPLYNYVVYNNSMSHGDDNFERRILRFIEHETILQETIKKIQSVQNADMSRYSLFVADKYAKHRMELAIKYNKKNAFKDVYFEKKNSIGVDLGDRASFIRSTVPMLNKPLGWFYRLSRWIRRRTVWKFEESNI